MTPGERGVPLRILGGMCRPVLQILTLFKTKKCLLNTRFQTWPLKSIPVFRPGIGRNYLIITWIRTPAKRSVLLALRDREYYEVQLQIYCRFDFTLYIIFAQFNHLNLLSNLPRTCYVRHVGISVHFFYTELG